MVHVLWLGIAMINRLYAAANQTGNKHHDKPRNLRPKYNQIRKSAKILPNQTLSIPSLDQP